MVARVVLDADGARRSGIAVAVAGPARIERGLTLPGRLGFDEERLAHVAARFPGVVREARKRVGDSVARGEVLAVVESDAGMRRYEVTSPLEGTVVDKTAVAGELAREEPLYLVADLRHVWLDLWVPAAEAGRIAVGQRLRAMAGDADVEGRIDHLSPLGEPATQTVLARAVLANPHGRLRPGLFATAEVAIAETAAAAAVEPSAPQTVDGTTVVFRAVEGAFEAVAVELGERDARHVEVRAGLAAGERYVTDGSFVLAAEARKSEASHEH